MRNVRLSPVTRTLGIAESGVTVTRAEYRHVAVDSQVERHTCIGHETLLAVGDHDVDHGNIRAIGGNHAAVGFGSKCGRLAGGLRLRGHCLLAVFISCGGYFTGLIHGIPAEMTVARHRLATEALAVDSKLNLVHVTVDPYLAPGSPS